MQCKPHLMLALAAGFGLGTVAIAQEPQRTGAPPDENLQQGDRNAQGVPSRQNPRDQSVGDKVHDAMAKRMDKGSEASISRQLADIRSNPETARDRLFVLHAGLGNLYEIRYSELVARKSQDAQVKELAEQVAQDHQQANEKLRPVAQALNVELPEDLPGMKQQQLAIMDALPVDQLEQAYLMDQKAMHAQAVTQFSGQANATRNDQLRTYVNETLPKLRDHTAHIVRVAQAKGAMGDLVLAAPGANEGQPGMERPNNDPDRMPTAGERRE